MLLGRTPFHWWWGSADLLIRLHPLPLQLEEEKAALVDRQRQAEQEACLAREEQERLEQLRREQEVEQQGLEGSLRVAEQARDTLEYQLPTLHQERCRLQEQLAQVGRGGGWRWERGGKGFQAPGLPHPVRG